MPQLPSWVPGRTLYQIHSLRAAGAPDANADVDADAPSGRGLQVLRDWLDHVSGLGCGGVLLTPICVSSTHGYDTVDPFRVDQRLGGDDDFDAFAAACHERDLKLVLDGVFNHVGRAFPNFRDVCQRGAESPFAGWFRLDFSRDDGDGFGYRCFEGHRELVCLNHHNDEVLDWAARVMCHWLGRGADGWRLDVAYAIPSSFLAALLARVHAAHPDAFVFGEVIHGDYAQIVHDSTVDSVTQYELYKAIWSSLNDGNFFELAWALKRNATFTTEFAPITFVGNHDVTRIASQLTDPSRISAALTLLFTLPGVPCVYYGDEYAWRGAKLDGEGGDDAVRPPLPSPVPEDGPVLATHRELIAFRRARPWLTRAEVEVLQLENRRITYVVTADGNHARVSIDLDANAISLQ